MNILEKDLEDIIWEAYEENPDILKHRGLYLYGTAFRQLNLGSYGIADIVTAYVVKNKGRYPNGNTYTERVITINVIELKKDLINVDTFLQAAGYCKGIQRFIEEFYPDFNFDIKFEITLIGKKVDLESNFCYLPDVYNVSILTYHADIVNGFKFQKHNDYKMTGESQFSISRSDKIKVNQIISSQTTIRHGEEVY
jgi:hypothetical protein